ncbi:hypothetical protein C3Y87_07210 [Carbonactinospora thermoautotrophica]|uniref:Uncharacterized protein n=1 Tax=Carbonactinospora thermoautotrophica TaxID=1469144 RepID=A0A132MPM0_9ACTN|nr:hypothetical protein [Carbonactinospora thermoautotrophica]KWW99807.1 hypothetical protein LI90_1446 [Carbonactinospora thermoautotrophica]KWX04456.1 hypothetical protein TH66_07730 [Carbonactinospora thermoautotrophica]KWX09552.1 hypothetical protein TR74_08910 [Carbonactinospora thermoautotrophica]MCX9191202.1 hypothetical protein [Carbonactinospora thermoautotrophica]
MPEPYDELLDELRELLNEIDPVPAEVVEAAKASFTWRTVDAELAELTEDSALAEAAGIRGPGGPRLLTFEAPDLTVVVEVSAIGDRRRMLGQLVPPYAAEVEVRHRDGTETVSADDLGRFTVEQVPAGPVSFACRSASRRTVVTSWVTV